ncbi:MAG TPA: dihydropyrimidinase [Aggregatilineales bacterium]|nr:dihydropyrimidinase [Aggregatilineales bacterium]
MPRTIVKGGIVITAMSSYRADVLIEGESILGIVTDATLMPGDQIIDATECYVMPGLIDAHTHIQLDTGIFKTPDDWAIGTQTAAWGGVTTVIDFATQYSGMTLDQAIDHRLTETATAVIDYSLHCMLTGRPDDEEIKRLVDRGVMSLKLFTTYRPNYYVDDAVVLHIMEAAARYNAIVMVHCENDSIVSGATTHLVEGGKTALAYHGRARPILAEEEAVNRILYLAEAAGCVVYVVHCSSAKSVQQVRRAVQRGVRAYCETCPQYLFLDDSLYLGDNPEHYILQPPLRPKNQSEALWKLITLGVIDVISTDHCDYTLAQKCEFGDFTRTPGGLPGLETMLPLMYTHSLDKARSPLTALVRMMSTNPARIFGLDHRKGDIRAGLDADVVIYDPKPRRYLQPDDLHNIAGYTPYEGIRLRGAVRTVLCRGQRVIEDGKFVGQTGYGQFIAGQPVKQ